MEISFGAPYVQLIKHVFCVDSEAEVMFMHAF